MQWLTKKGVHSKLSQQQVVCKTQATAQPRSVSHKPKSGTTIWNAPKKKHLQIQVLFNQVENHRRYTYLFSFSLVIFSSSLL